jgi:hypothetical protein
MPENDTTAYVLAALKDAGYDVDSFGQLDTGMQREILELARERASTDSVQ